MSDYRDILDIISEVLLDKMAMESKHSWSDRDYKAMKKSLKSLIVEPKKLTVSLKELQLSLENKHDIDRDMRLKAQEVCPPAHEFTFFQIAEHSIDDLFDQEVEIFQVVFDPVKVCAS